MWQHVRNWFASHGNATLAFLPDEDDEGVYANQGYLRLWLEEVAIRKNRAERGDYVLAFYGGVALTFAGAADTPFAQFTRLPGDHTSPGAALSLPVTPLLPFEGGQVEVQAAMYRTPSSGPLAAAAAVAGALTGISDAPLSWVAATSARLAVGLDSLLNSVDVGAALAAQWTGDGQLGGRMLRPGHLVLVNAPQDQLGRLRVMDGRLRTDDAANSAPLSAADYLVLRLECRTERGDWRLPQLDTLIRAALNASLNGQLDSYRAKRAEAIVYAWTCAELTPADRVRVARLVAAETDTWQVEAVAYASLLDRSRLSEPDDPVLSQVDLPGLLGGEYFPSGR